VIDVSEEMKMALISLAMAAIVWFGVPMLFRDRKGGS
jgi:hypothetical protein